MPYLRRREFITLLGGAAAWPLVAHAQQPTTSVIGFLHHTSPELAGSLRTAFAQGLREVGFIEGQNIRIEYRWAENHFERLPELAADLVRREVAVIFTTTPSLLHAKAAAGTTPIVFMSVDDPVRLGVVASFNRPGGNATGIYALAAAMEGKRAQLLHELVPKATTIALLVDPNHPSAEAQSQEMREAVHSLGLNLLVLNAGTQGDIDAGFTTLVRERVGALAVSASGFFFFLRAQLLALAARHGIPAIYPWRDAVADGGLVSYGPSITDGYRQAGIYVGRILRGEKAADLPVQQSVKVELVINLKTAQTLGLTFPITLLGRADEVIE
jgi:putative tryptophan/tyrosine transport system substrate-binding protein